MTSAGASGQARSYQFTDKASQARGYYRLRQVDQDGATAFIPVVAVSTNWLPNSLAAYPSMVTTTLTISNVVETILAVIDQSDRILQRVVAPAALLQVDVQYLPAGNQLSHRQKRALYKSYCAVSDS